MKELYDKLWETSTTLKQQYAIIQYLQKYQSDFQYRKRIAPLVVEMVNKKIMTKKEIHHYIYLSDLPFLQDIVPLSFASHCNIGDIHCTPFVIDFFVNNAINPFKNPRYIYFTAEGLSEQDWENLYTLSKNNFLEGDKYELDATSIRSLTFYLLRTQRFSDINHYLNQRVIKTILNDRDLINEVIRLYNNKTIKQNSRFIAKLSSVLSQQILNEDQKRLEALLPKNETRYQPDWTLDIFLKNEYRWGEFLEYNGTLDDFLTYLTSKNFHKYVQKEVLPRIGAHPDYYYNIESFREILTKHNAFYTHMKAQALMKEFYLRELNEPGYLLGVIQFIKTSSLQQELIGTKFILNIDTLMDEYNEYQKITRNNECDLHI